MAGSMLSALGIFLGGLGLFFAGAGAIWWVSLYDKQSKNTAAK